MDWLSFGSCSLIKHKASPILFISFNPNLYDRHRLKSRHVTKSGGITVGRQEKTSIGSISLYNRVLYCLLIVIKLELLVFADCMGTARHLFHIFHWLSYLDCDKPRLFPFFLTVSLSILCCFSSFIWPPTISWREGFLLNGWERFNTFFVSHQALLLKSPSQEFSLLRNLSSGRSALWGNATANRGYA